MRWLTIPFILIFSLSSNCYVESITNADSLLWCVIFDKDMQNVNSEDFSVSGTTAPVGNVLQISATTYDITISGGDNNTFVVNNTAPTMTIIRLMYPQSCILSLVCGEIDFDLPGTPSVLDREAYIDTLYNWALMSATPVQIPLQSAPPRTSAGVR